MGNKASWYESWFNTPYYHILYKNRDYSEAQGFIDNLLQYLNPTVNQHILDLACGKGRHSIYMNEKGYKVTGVDLASESIRLASVKANDRLDFHVHDMLEPLNSQYDFIFNLFTSFGYFESDDLHEKVIQNMSNGLLSKGILVIDFLNAPKVISNMVAKENKVVDGLEFFLERSLVDGYITKNIKFVDNGLDYAYQEKVRAYILDDFKVLLKKSGLEIQAVFGDYNLSDYEEGTSNRLIVIAQKL